MPAVRPAAAAVVAAVAVVAAAQAMSHNAGQNCMNCHRTNGTAASRIFTVAGTVYLNNGSAQTNATVVLTPSGSNTAQATLTTDGSGNFYTTQAVASLVPAAGQQLALGANVTVRPTWWHCAHHAGPDHQWLMQFLPLAQRRRRARHGPAGRSGLRPMAMCVRRRPAGMANQAARPLRPRYLRRSRPAPHMPAW